jgi:uncharacterized protein YwqG
MTKEDLNERINAISWENDASRILNSPEISLRLTAVNGPVTFGQSKMGGVPDIQDPVKAKMISESAMEFYAQINFSEVQAIYPSSSFPAEGVVFFFAKNWEQKSNAYPVLAEDYLVLYEKQGADNRPTTGVKLSFSEVLTIPSLESNLYDSLSESDQEAYNELFSEITEENDLDFSERLFGHCHPIQAYPDWGRNFFLKRGVSTLTQEQSQQADRVRDSFVLLLQCLYDEDGSEMYWGISKEDLASGKFENAILDVHTS